MEHIELTILVDNNAQEGLAAEHGFSLWVESDNKTILFDTGNKNAFTENVNLLGKDVSRVTDLVISHGHYDHTGGVEMVLQKAKGAEVFLHQGAFLPRYVKDADSARAIRVPENALKALDRFADTRVHWATRPLSLDDSIGVTGPIPRNNDIEDVGGDFYLDMECSRPDRIEDDLAMWIKTKSGVVVCVGCSHAGIINTLEAVRSITGDNRIRTVIGGMHLVKASPERLEFTVSELNRMGVKQVIPCHCTGDAAVEYMEKNLEAEVIKGYAGFSVTI